VQGTNNGKFRVYDLPPDLVLMTQLLGSWEAPDAGPQVRFQGAPGGGFIDIGQDGIGSFVIEPGDVPRLTVTADGRVGLGLNVDARLAVFRDRFGEPAHADRVEGVVVVQVRKRRLVEMDQRHRIDHKPGSGQIGG
jgi:hypothetical protein